MHYFMLKTVLMVNTQHHAGGRGLAEVDKSGGNR